jgi:hypothetical protein
VSKVQGHEIDWYVCTADESDVEAAAKMTPPKTIAIGDEFWRVPVSIGPVYADSNHLSGCHLSGDHRTWAQMTAAPRLEAAIRGLLQLVESPSRTDHPALVEARAALDSAQPNPSWK